MERDLQELVDEFIDRRCDIELHKNNEYLILQNKLANAHDKNDIDAFSELSFKMQELAVRTSYKLAINDKEQLLHN